MIEKKKLHSKEVEDLTGYTPLMEQVTVYQANINDIEVLLIPSHRLFPNAHGRIWSQDQLFFNGSHPYLFRNDEGAAGQFLKEAYEMNIMSDCQWWTHLTGTEIEACIEVPCIEV